MKILDSSGKNWAKITEGGAFLVEGLEDWIDLIIPSGHSGIFQDSKTKVRYEIKKVKEEK